MYQTLCEQYYRNLIMTMYVLCKNLHNVKKTLCYTQAMKKEKSAELTQMSMIPIQVANSQ